MNRNFFKHDGERINDIVEYINSYRKLYPGYLYKIYVGCDSQVNTKHTMYSVAIGIHRVGHGVHILHTKEIDKRYRPDKASLFVRLWGEVERIAETAMYLRDNGIDVDDIDTHIDTNGCSDFASNIIYNSAMGYLKSLGFDVKGKPDAFCATYAANRYCR